MNPQKSFIEVKRGGRIWEVEKWEKNRFYFSIVEVAKEFAKGVKEGLKDEG